MPDVFVNKKKKSHKRKSVKPEYRSTHEVPSEEELIKLPGHTSNPLSAYCYYPKHINFSHADEEEKIVLLVRKHPITNLTWVFIAVLMSLAPLSLSVVPFLDFLPLNFQIISLVLWYLLVIAFVFEQFLTWFFNVNIITDERVFDVDFYNLLYREITDANLDQIQDVTVRMGSAVRTLFNYGDVIIQTAAEIPQIEFQAVPYPDRIAKVLRDLRVEEEIEKLEGRIR